MGGRGALRNEWGHVPSKFFYTYTQSQTIAIILILRRNGPVPLGVKDDFYLTFLSQFTFKQWWAKLQLLRY